LRVTIPNLITIFRLILVPVVIVAIMQGRWSAAFILFVVAGVSDGVDGFIAKRFDMRSEFGAYIDPLADKALLVSIYVTLAIVGVLPSWLAIVVVSRDIMIVAAVLLSWVMARPVKIRPLLISKLNTVAQIALATLVLSTKAFGIDASTFVDVAMVAVAGLTIASTGAYLAGWLRHMTGEAIG
jgi:cardiolipin synthase